MPSQLAMRPSQCIISFLMIFLPPYLARLFFVRLMCTVTKQIALPLFWFSYRYIINCRESTFFFFNFFFFRTVEHRKCAQKQTFNGPSHIICEKRNNFVLWQVWNRMLKYLWQSHRRSWLMCTKMRRILCAIGKLSALECWPEWVAAGHTGRRHGNERAHRFCIRCSLHNSVTWPKTQYTLCYPAMTTMCCYVLFNRKTRGLTNNNNKKWWYTAYVLIKPRKFHNEY